MELAAYLKNEVIQQANSKSELIQDICLLLFYPFIFAYESFEKHKPIPRVLYTILAANLYGLFLAVYVSLTSNTSNTSWLGVLTGYSCISLMLLFFRLLATFSIENRKRRYFIRRYAKLGDPSGWFANKDYTDAAEALRTFKPCLYEEGEREYGETIMAILTITKSIASVPSDDKTVKIKRVISLKAVEKDADGFDFED